MSQRYLVMKALEDGGVLSSGDPRVQAFVTHIMDNPDRCWSDFVSDFRNDYYDLFDVIVPALEQSQDPMIRNTLIKFANPQQAKERQLLGRIAEEADFERNPVAAKKLRRLQIREIDAVLQRRPASTTASPSPGTTSTTDRPRRRRSPAQSQ